MIIKQNKKSFAIWSARQSHSFFLTCFEVWAAQRQWFSVTSPCFFFQSYVISLKPFLFECASSIFKQITLCCAIWERKSNISAYPASRSRFWTILGWAFEAKNSTFFFWSCIPRLAITALRTDFMACERGHFFSKTCRGYILLKPLCLLFWESLFRQFCVASAEIFRNGNVLLKKRSFWEGKGLGREKLWSHCHVCGLKRIKNLPTPPFQKKNATFSGGVAFLS